MSAARRKSARERAEAAALNALLEILEDENAGCGQKLDAAKILLSTAAKSAPAPTVRVLLPEGAEGLMG